MIHKKLISLLVLLMTVASGAWATVYNSGEVNSAVLKVGDVIIYPASIHNKFKLAANRYEYNGSVQTDNSYEFLNMGLGTNGSLSGGYTPVTADGQDGNAWVVVEKMSVSPNSGEVQVLLGGIIYDPNSVYPTTDAQKEGDPFTEATFTMPAFDATVDYDIVRDMNDATYPVEFAGIPEPTTTGGVSKIVVKKNSTSGKFEFLNDITIQLIDNISGTDVDIIEATGITIKVLKGEENQSGAIEYDQENPIKLSEFLENTEPGYYWIKAVPTDETTSPYIGTVYSYEMLLIKGYEVEVPAGEFATYYKDENLFVEDTEAQLYTITSIGESTATATELSVAAANTPLLVKNNSNATKTILLIPTFDQADDVTAYLGFVGTLEATTIAASTNSQNNYAMNGKEFIWVRTAIPVAANKAWLEVPVSSGNNANIRIVFDNDETTEIVGVDSGELTVDSDDSWYDLSGRKLDGEPTTKGVYIKNGRKVVIK